MLSKRLMLILVPFALAALTMPFAFGQQAEEPSPPSGVRVISSEPCVLWNAHCHVLGVTCQGLPERQVLVREFQPKDPIGAVIFTTGGVGNTSYVATFLGSDERERTVKTVLSAGYEAFEVIWRGEEGWAAGVRQGGFKKAMCAYAEVVRWIAAKRANNPGVMCAQGGSGGAFQIAYGLSVYGLEDLLDMVILTGGPPVSRMDVACFGTDDPDLKAAEWPENLRRNRAGPLNDRLMGWENNGDYCRKGSGPKEALRQLQAISLASPTEPRDYSFPRTKVNFVNSEADGTHANHQGRIYYEKITSTKAWYEIPGRAHGIERTKEGAKIIRELFLNECKAQ